MTKYSKREERLLLSLKTQRRLDIKQVTGLLNISEATARRLFSELENQGKLIRVHGGISSLPEARLDYSFDASDREQNEEKGKIGVKAALLVQDNSIIFLDSGTTLLRLSLSLKERILNKELKNLTVVTNSLVNLTALGQDCKVIVIGGEYRSKRMDFSGYLSEKTVQNLRFNLCFLGADGVRAEEGFMTTDADTARLSETVISRSDKCIVLADSSKFSRGSFVSFAGLDKAEEVISDNKLSDELQGAFLPLIRKLTLV